MMNKIIYLDNSATTEVRPEVRQAMERFQQDSFGNGSSIHQLGKRSRAAIDQARVSVAKMLNAKASEIFFTPCATYSNNTALLGRARYVEEQGLGRHIITSPLEHASVAGPIKHLESRGWTVTVLRVNRDGVVDLDHLKDALTCHTSIISVMWANNEIGTIQPIEEIAAIASRRNIFFHCDAVQIAGKAPIDVAAVKVDCLSISGHKFHAPKGIGVLYVREGVELMPIVFGGGQEEGLFPGTENVANIVGLGVAAELSSKNLNRDIAQLRRMQEILVDKLISLPGVTITGPRDLTERVPGHVSLLIDGAYGEDLVEQADAKSICVSSASACSSKGGHASHVLKALGFSDGQSQGSLRIAAGLLNSVEECWYAVGTLAQIIAPELNVPVLQGHATALIA